MDNKRAPYNPNANPELNAMVMLAAAMGGGMSNAIEESERVGQSSLVNSDTLPTNFQGREALEAAGVKFGAAVKGDPMFTYVELPAGWTKRSTGHAMWWSDLVDDKGRKRASIFYKAAFYDRSAHGSALPRYRTDSYYNDDHDTVAVCRVLDQDVVLFESERLEMKTNDERYGSRFDAPVKVESKRDIVGRQCVAWLDEHYPDWKNPAAYWD